MSGIALLHRVVVVLKELNTKQFELLFLFVDAQVSVVGNLALSFYFPTTHERVRRDAMHCDQGRLLYQFNFFDNCVREKDGRFCKNRM